MDKGWVKLHRAVLENHFLMHDDNAYLVFTKLLMLVGKNKGQWAGGRHQLGEFLNMNPRTVYDILKRLENQQIITIEPNKKYSVITICNWFKYQQSSNSTISKSPTVTQPQPNSKPTASQHSNKKEKKKENSTNVLMAIKSPEHERVSKLFYEAIKSLELPVTNHNLIHVKIKQLWKEADFKQTCTYLEFMRDKFTKLTIAYKPEVNTALDIYTKRVQIMNAFKRAVKEQNESRTGVVL